MEHCPHVHCSKTPAKRFLEKRALFNKTPVKALLQTLLKLNRASAVAQHHIDGRRPAALDVWRPAASHLLVVLGLLFSPFSLSPSSCGLLRPQIKNKRKKRLLRVP